MDWATFGNEMRKLRKQKGWDQRKFAKRIGKQQYAISKYENGKAPTGPVLAEIAKQLEMRFLDFEKSSLTQAADGQPSDEAIAGQLELPFEEGTELWIALEPRGEPVARITCKKVGTHQLVVTAAVEKKNKKQQA